MNMKNYLVTNNGAGTITLMGLRRVEIPGNVQNMPLALPAETAKATVARLKQRYPLLKIVEVKGGNEAPASAPAPTPAAPASSEETQEAENNEANAQKAKKSK